jgi:hypothetical protein
VYLNLIRVGGFRVSEYAQKTQTKVDQFEYALGNKVIKAFIPSDWQFYNASGCLTMMHSLNGLAEVAKQLRITFRIQKNRKNEQKITFTADDKHPHICPVWSAYQIFLRAKGLGQSDDQPMGVYLNHQGIVKYLTGNKISKLLQSIAKHCHPDLTKDEISRFSSHSGRVWAVVLLDEAGMTSDFIKSQLHWMGDSYRLYLRDTVVLQAKHVTALEQSSFDFISLYGESCTTLPDIVPEDDSRGLIEFYQSWRKRGGIPISKEEGRNPILQKSITLLLHWIFSFFCMPAIHSGVVILKTKVLLVYVLLFV